MSPGESKEGIMKLRFIADEHAKSQDTNSAIAHACAGCDSLDICFRL